MVLQCVVDFLPESRMALSHEIGKVMAYALALELYIQNIGVASKNIYIVEGLFYKAS